MNRRHLLAGATALAACAALPTVPAVTAETLKPACQVDRAAFANRLHQWAFHCPALGGRIDAMLSRVDTVLSTGDGTGELLEIRALCEERLGRDLSLDWLVIGEGTYPNGEPHRMFHDEPPAEPVDGAEAALLRDFRACSVENQAGIMELARAMSRRDYAAARHWSGYLNRLAGITVAQI